MPEVRFDDVITLKTEGKLSLQHKIDEEFVYVCEEDSIEAIGYSTSEPSLCGININKNIISVKFSGSIPESITIKISGIRKGRKDKRFPIFSEEEMKKNLAFWSSWSK